ncbi:hypothetical protein F0562_008684 [Nyssa sinensis]|uniref:Coiled-coil domain-containing protein 22 homolog n=1 Tax=Nyssa sinensis TaxID=561372 RepID=A0A5J5AC95_9ASTE|nr:hypothetical protein F0562_008684 [Nyssa sinensis]
MADQFRICNELASAVKNLGFCGDISFHKFLYPSEEDLYKLVRFLVERLSELSEVGITADKRNINASATIMNDDLKGTSKDWTPKADSQGVDLNDQEVRTGLKGLRLKTEVPESSNSKISESRMPDSSGVEVTSMEIGKRSTEEFWDSKIDAPVNEETAVQRDDKPVSELEHKLNLLKEQSSKIRDEIEKLQSRVKMFMEETQKSVVWWNWSCNGILSEHLWKRKGESVLSETKRREEEHSKLSTDFERQPKLASRRSYIQRITEITKNSRKQDADIERILKETRELQLESNSIQERLHRTYAVVDETVFREAKKDPVARQAYRLLTSIHESFELISEKILATDRTRREAAEREAKLAALASQSLNIDKLQADLDAIRKENELLQHRLH